MCVCDVVKACCSAAADAAAACCDDVAPVFWACLAQIVSCLSSLRLFSSNVSEVGVLNSGSTSRSGSGSVGAMDSGATDACTG